MSSDRVRWLLAWLALFPFLPAGADTQLYESPERFRNERLGGVSTWTDRAVVVPNAAIQGDWLLTAWGPAVVEAPALVVMRVSTGEVTCVLKAEPGRHVAAILIDGQLHTSGKVQDWIVEWRDGQRHQVDGVSEHQIRNPNTGEVLHTAQYPISSLTTVRHYLNTVFIAGHKEVFDLHTAERRGELPDEVNYNQIFREIDGRIYVDAMTSDQTEQPDLLEIDLQTLQITRRFALKTLLPDMVHYTPMLSDGQRLILDVFKGQLAELPHRSLAALDLERGVVAWQADVAFHAPLLFVDDLTAEPDLPVNLFTRPLLVEWSTGRHRLGPMPNRGHDLVRWAVSISDLRSLVEFEDGLAAHVVRASGRQELIRINSLGMPLWSHDLEPAAGNQNLAALRVSGPLAVLTSAFEVAILDLKTGDIVRRITPQDVGLKRKSVLSPELEMARSAPKAPSTSAGQTAAASSDSGVTKIGLAILALLAGYVLLRGATLLRSK